MAEIGLGLALYGLYGHTTYFKSACLQLLIDPASHSVGSTCSIGGNTLRVYSYTFIRTQGYVCLFACECVCCAQCLWLCAHWLAIEQISWLQIPKHIHTPVSCLPGIMLVSVRAPRAISHSCFVWHFVCLVLLLCFLPCLDLPRLKTIRYHDLTFSQKTSPLLFFAFFGFYSIDIVFALFLLCYIKCCKFVLILQSKLPCPLLDILPLATKPRLYNLNNFSH